MTPKAGKPAGAKSTPTEDRLPVRRRSGETDDAALARTAYDPAARAVGVGRKFIAPVMGERKLAESFAALERQIASIKSGDLSEVERKLVAQADTLDAIFNEMALRAALNSAQYLESMDIYMRLALKAQSQCRATLETLVGMKHPPVVFAKQANIAAGPQQVNNGVARPARAREEKYEIDNQSHAPEAARPNAPSSGPALLSHEQALPMPLQSTGSERTDRVPDARCASRSTEGRG